MNGPSLVADQGQFLLGSTGSYIVLFKGRASQSHWSLQTYHYPVTFQIPKMGTDTLHPNLRGN